MEPIPKRLTLVYAAWCPHCVPISVDRIEALAARLKVPWRLLDVDRPDEERAADLLVRSYGDWSEDYLVPQLFLEWADGRVTHLLTGDPSSTEGTVRRWERLLSGEGAARS